ncbi:homoserine dehydrogenase [Limisphaera sp. VF-2]|jgi:homoserine dehydrogenase|uniref:homoserine dehydrogenase n=1 Tax=Limisphaera sp. VF-2 TaxID=3400418 RepID=UPI00175E38D1|nr:homoserine dehydrogenase [Limisphaera sp.]
MEVLNLGMVGGGTVGSGVFHALQRNGELLAARIGIRIQVRKVAVKAVDEPRPYPIPRSLLTTDWREVVEDPNVHLVTELVGGTTVARTIVRTALRLGKPVITANKALLSAHGPELFAEARAHGTNLYYEASVCGGIPIIKALREGFVGNQIVALYGIVNGTCNYILTRMAREQADFATVLAEAQREGYAETPPDLDIDGHDAQHKTGILASLAHGFWVPPSQIHVEGIRSVTLLDLQFAAQLGYSIKLLGIVKRLDGAAPGRGRGPAIQVAVYPALIPTGHVLAGVQGVYNAVLVRGDVVGDTLFYGRGAGKDATASAVLSDLADAALDLRFGSRQRRPAFVEQTPGGRVVPMEQVVSRSFVRLSVVDRPGVLARIAAVFGQARIGIASVIQPEGHTGEVVPLIFMLHEAPDGAVCRALARIARLPVVKAPPVRFRVEPLDQDGPSNPNAGA